MTESAKRHRRTKADIEASIENAAKELILEKGFSGMLVTDLIKQAKIEPVVFYNRYENLSKFYEEFVKKYDFWFKDVMTGVPFEPSSFEGYVRLLQDVHKALSQDSIMLELLRWEVTEGNDTTQRTAKLREGHIMPLARRYEELFGDSNIDIVAVSSLLFCGIYYLHLHKERSQFADLDVTKREGRKRVSDAIDKLATLIFTAAQENRTLDKVAARLRENGVDENIIKKCVYNDFRTELSKQN